MDQTLGRATSALPSAAPAPAAPAPRVRRAPASLYTPAAIGWIAFFCTLPAGFVLAALNYRSAGRGRQGLARLGAAALSLIGLGAIVGNAGSLSGVLCLAVEIAGIVYLVRDTRALHRSCRATFGAYNASSTNALIVGLLVLAAIVATMIWSVGRVIG